ncbi:hypothetical protein TCAL_14201 [Tigriopus californicus]|uniref:Uncharacterized protein n=1 Tax=Tigriopus californicus TaxID=6832 RepID=A0A553NSP4_TIGCA|nr:hypothetical protein TCAL_14201 [Tigriopus californicus]
MLLCCFKEKKSKRNSYDVNHRHDMPSTKRDSALLEPAYQPTRNSIISDRSVTPPSAKRRDWKERAPLQREEKKLMKQRSRDSFSRDDPTLSFPYIDSSTTTTNNEEIGSPGVRSDKFLTSSYASSYSSPINNNKIGSAENNYNHRGKHRNDEHRPRVTFHAKEQEEEEEEVEGTKGTLSTKGGQMGLFLSFLVD